MSNLHPSHQDPEIYRERRARLMQSLGPGLLVLSGGKLKNRNSDVDYPFRQDSDFYYLCGFEEPDSLLLISLDKDDYLESTLIVPPRDIEREIWDGRRHGVEGAVKEFGVDKAYSNTEAAERLFAGMQGHDVLYHNFQRDTHTDALVLSTLKRFKSMRRQNPVYPQSLQAYEHTLALMRQIKSDAEVEWFQQCVDISVRAHDAVMRSLRPGMNECEIQALLQYEYMRAGGDWGYGHIVASGANATCLHYTQNNAQMQQADLLLIDSGCELPHKFTTDVTRCYPVSGRFEGRGREIYAAVLDVQKKAVDACVVGSSIRDVHRLTQIELARVLIDLNVLEGDPEGRVEDGSVQKFYMHGTSHWLGMDVHDVGRYDAEDGKPWSFQPGMMLTVEPGLYFNPDFSKTRTAFDGIGVRIEDNVLIQNDGPVNLTSRIPKEIEAIEAVMASRKDA